MKGNCQSHRSSPANNFALPVALLVLGITWGAAIFLVTQSYSGGIIAGTVFLVGKGVMILSSLAGALRNPRMAAQLFLSRYRFSPRLWCGFGQALTRFTWELPQLCIGYAVAQWRVAVGNVSRVDTLNGVTFLTKTNPRKHNYAGLSIGCFVNMWIPDTNIQDFKQYALHSPFRIYAHEYGHTVDSQLWGWLYLPVVGLPSLVSQALGLSQKGRHRHDNFWVERRADRLGKRFFEQLA